MARRPPGSETSFFPLSDWLGATSLRASLEQVESPAGVGKFVVRSAAVACGEDGSSEDGPTPGGADLSAGGTKVLQRFGVRYPGAEE